MPDKIRWGVISTAVIGTKKVIPGTQRSKLGVVTAIASRDESRARAAADELGIEKAYGSYEALLADPDIDAIYNPLPNNLHVEWTLKAVEAGKHVLCEKPFAMTAEDAVRMKAVDGRRLVMEAFMVRQHPQWLRARELVRSGAIGELKAVQVFFAYDNRDPDNIRNKPETGGGGIMDIGCYGIVSGRFTFEAEPTRVVALVDRDSSFGTDRLASVIADFGAGRHLTFTVGTQIVPHQRVTLAGTTGRIEILIPFNAPQGEALIIRVDDGSGLGDASARDETIVRADQYAEQADAFARAVLGQADLPYGIDDAIRNMRIIDAIFRSEQSGQWESTGL